MENYDRAKKGIALKPLPHTSGEPLGRDEVLRVIIDGMGGKSGVVEAFCRCTENNDIDGIKLYNECLQMFTRYNN